MFVPEDAYAEEPEFVTQLADALEESYIVADETGQTAQLDTAVELPRTSDGLRPDITVSPSEFVDLGERTLSMPFYVECKLGGDHSTGGHATAHKQVLTNLDQLLRYKYIPGTEAHERLAKYGDYHVVATAPAYLTADFTATDYSEPYPNTVQLIRTLWHLGLGVLYRPGEDEALRIAFNETETLSLHSSPPT